MDKINKLDDEIKKKKIETLTNIEPFIQYFNIILLFDFEYNIIV